MWLDPGTEYYFYTKCFTKAGVADLRRSNGFIYDPTPPLQGTAWIGDEGGTEQWVQATGGRVYVYMQNFVDPESAIQFFYVALGTCVDDPACVDDLVGFVQVQGVGYCTIRLSLLKQRRPPTALGCKPTAVSYPPTAAGYPPTAVGYPPTAVGYPPTAVGHPPTAGCPPYAVGFPPTAASYFPAWPAGCGRRQPQKTVAGHSATAV